ncbi:MAG: helix-turn-helix transcriptional regulator [Ruminococcaceae bacterium]|nr:helix-turn-helix transcriptional regulator [Oscillospiraceae bacterium]
MSDFLAFNIVDIGLMDRKAISMETKNKECYVLSCRLTGSAIYNTRLGALNVMAGDILYCPKGEYYSQKTKGERIVYIHLDIIGNKYNKMQHLVTANPQETIEFFEKIATIWKQKPENYKYICTAMLYELIAKTSIMLPDNSKNILAPALQYINEHFCDIDFSLDSACSKSNISRSYFNRIFKKQFSVTPVQYINKLKIERAKFLLSCDAYTHEEIANLCGFNDTKYFYTVFKSVTNTVTKKFKQHTFR